MTHRTWTLAAFCVCVLVEGFGSPLAASQAVTISGRTTDAVSGQAVPGALLTIGSHTVVTDAEGRFKIDVPGGRGEIEVTARDYTSRKIPFDTTDQTVALEIALIPKNRFQERLDVTAPALPPAEPASIPLRPRQVMSTAGSLDNPFRTLQTLPGVAGTDEFGSKLSVRGGAPDQNLTLMDDMEIHNPYRLFGLTSAFNPETVGRFELMAGGFGARYGDRLSSVVVVENRDGDRRKAFGASASVSITDANIIGEGRLPGPGQGSWLATARRTYYDLVAERFVDQDLPSFNDAQVKTTWRLPGSSRLSLVGLRSREITSIKPDEDTGGTAEIRSHNDLIGATVDGPLWGASSRTVVGWSRNTDLIDIRDEDDVESRDDADRLTRQLSIEDLSFKQDVRFPAMGRHAIEAGTEWHRLQTHVAFSTFDDRDPFGLLRGGAVWLGGVFPEQLDHERHTTRGGAWIEDRAQFGPLSVVPGLRWDWSGLNGRAALSPRLNAVVSLNAVTRVRAATGLYTQSPGYEKLLQADHFTDLTAAGRLDLRPERATHVVGGIERDFSGGVRGRVEAYWKGFSDLIVGRLETEAERMARLARYAFPPSLQSSLPTAALITSEPTNDSRGEAYGLDLFLARTEDTARRSLTGWIWYSLARAEQDIYGRRLPFSYDRRHSLSVVWNWRIGRHFDFSGTSRAASGFPRTPPAGVRPVTVEVGRRLFPVVDQPGHFAIEVAPGGVAELNAARMPTFARVDLRFAYRPADANGRWDLYVEVLNALKHNNPWFVDAEIVDEFSSSPQIHETPTGGLPRVATFGIRVRLR